MEGTKKLGNHQCTEQRRAKGCIGRQLRSVKRCASIELCFVHDQMRYAFNVHHQQRIVFGQENCLLLTTVCPMRPTPSTSW
ncbi:unnamed protein product [Macrosiphum euphorbiae]|uniref:Uncharacterized protein n=1 Tax=Macrosiphum euphorbiae TaxID=13131 RepID=A0AAV0XM19_9HEMI|nr:unnamed protein product [Macrosiphum euphorbiae]